MDRFRKLSKLLSTYNPFGVVEGNDYISYPTTRDAYVDIMMRISNLAPMGYVDIPLVMAIFQGVPVYAGIQKCRFRPEIIRIPADETNGEVMDVWEELLKRLLEVTNIQLQKDVFYAAWVEFIQLKMKQNALDEVTNRNYEEYYETGSKEGADDTEGNQE